MATPKFTVAICGGGIGGLSLAVFLSRCPDIQIDVYESATRFAEIGAGIGMWSRTWRIMQAMGLAEDLARIAEVAPMDQQKTAFIMRKGDEPQGYTFQRLDTRGGLINYHRPDLQRVLLQHLSPHCGTHTSKRLVSYGYIASSPSSSSSRRSSSREKERIELQFHDGTTAQCDLLVGADGVKSAVRACMLRERAATVRARAHSPESGSGSETRGRVSPARQRQLEVQAEAEVQDLLRAVPPVWSGMLSYRTTITSEVLNRRWPGHRVLSGGHLYMGNNSQMTIYPIGPRGALINVSAFRARYECENSPLDGPWVQDVAPGELVADFESWEPEVRAVLDCVEKTSRWAVPTVLPLSTFVSVRGDVILLGDAAHAMMPFQGAGAGQAIEDAYILAALLTHAHTTRAALPRATAIYDAVRRPFAQHVARMSREAGLLYTLNYPGLAFDGGRLGAGEVAEGMGSGASAADREKLQAIYERVRDNWKWAWETTVEGDRERAVAMLEGRVPVA